MILKELGKIYKGKEELEFGYLKFLDFIAYKKKINRACLNGKVNEIELFKSIYNTLDNNKNLTEEISIAAISLFPKVSAFSNKRKKLKNIPKTNKPLSLFIKNDYMANNIEQYYAQNKNLKFFAVYENEINFKLGLIALAVKEIPCYAILCNERVSRYTPSMFDESIVNTW